MLGQGTFSTVWLAKIKVSAKDVAVKFPNVVNRDTFDDLMYEMNILSRFKSPYILENLNFMLWGQEVHATIEYCSNGQLTHFLSKFSASPTHVQLKLADQIYQGVSVIHAAQIIHFDLKPDNILLDEHFNAKISDFGLAREKEENDSLAEDELEPRGSYFWMAPEILFKPYCHSFAGDVWSMSIISLQIVTGQQNPFPSPAVSQDELREILTTTHKAGWTPNLEKADPEFAKIIHAGLDRNHLTRPSAQHLAESLSKLLASHKEEKIENPFFFRP
jgi:serine/threonine protein kinase